MDVTRTQISQILDVTVNQISAWLRMGLPVNTNGTYDVAKCVQWYIDKLKRDIKDSVTKQVNIELRKKIRAEYNKKLETNKKKIQHQQQLTEQKHELQKELEEQRHLQRVAEKKLSNEISKLSDIEIKLIKKRMERYDVEIRRAEVRLEQEQNRLFPIKEGRQLIAEELSLMRNVIMSLPGRSAKYLVNKTDETEIYNIIRDFCIEILQQLSNPRELQLTGDDDLLPDLEEPFDDESDY